VIINCFIKDDVFYLPLSLTHEIPEIVVEQKVKLELDIVVFHKLYVLIPNDILLYCDFNDFGMSFDVKTVTNHDETFSIENLLIFFIRFYLQVIDCH
jgi:hypothetical protein